MPLTNMDVTLIALAAIIMPPSILGNASNCPVRMEPTQVPTADAKFTLPTFLYDRQMTRLGLTSATGLKCAVYTPPRFGKSKTAYLCPDRVPFHRNHIITKKAVIRTEMRW